MFPPSPARLPSDYSRLFSDDRPVTVGITAGALCPNNLIEETLVKNFELRGISKDPLVGA
ncbi:hypothetical protein HQ447_05285 [bacterium]|nr:hypothetical protein [bacterium]